MPAAKNDAGPLATKELPNKVTREDKREKEVERLLPELRKGMPTVTKLLNAMTPAQRDLAERALKFIASLSPQGLLEQYGGASVEQAATLLRRASLAILHVNGIVDASDQTGADREAENATLDSRGTEDGGRGNAVAGLDASPANADGNKQGVSATADVGSSPKAGASEAAQRLQAYLDQHADKNKLWASVARKALAENNEKQITGTLAAAKKQFGELSQREPVAQPVSQTGELSQYDRRVEANKAKAAAALAAWNKANNGESTPSKTIFDEVDEASEKSAVAKTALIKAERELYKLEGTSEDLREYSPRVVEDHSQATYFNEIKKFWAGLTPEMKSAFQDYLNKLDAYRTARAQSHATYDKHREAMRKHPDALKLFIQDAKKGVDALTGHEGKLLKINVDMLSEMVLNNRDQAWRDSEIVARERRLAKYESEPKTKGLIATIELIKKEITILKKNDLQDIINSLGGNANLAGAWRYPTPVQAYDKLHERANCETAGARTKPDQQSH